MIGMVKMEADDNCEYCSDSCRTACSGEALERNWITLLNVTVLEHVGMTVYFYEGDQDTTSDTIKAYHILNVPNDANVENVRSINEDFDLFVITTKQKV